jgi:CRP-like cAMP-binding protein
MLGDEEKEAFLAVAHREIYGRNEQLFSQGESARSAAVIQTGLVKISSESSNGARNTLVLRGQGDLVGESASADRPRIATVTASSEEVRALSLSAKQFLAFLQRYAGAAQALQRTYSDRLVQSDRLRMEVRTATSAQRLARCLLELADDVGRFEDGKPGMILDVALSQEEFGELSCAATVMIERTLRNWRRRSIVATGYLKVTVLDLPALRRIAGQELD